MLGLGQTDPHSRLVIWLRILLPLAALAVMSTLFMVSRPVNPEDAIPYASVDVADRLRDPRLTGPTFAGMTQDGAALTFKADTALPGVPGSALAGQARNLSGLIETPDGVRTDVAAALATMDDANRVVSLTGGVTLHNSTGYQVKAAGLTLSLDRTRMETAGAVDATGPLGQVHAGKLLITKDASGLYKLDFTEGVRLLYQPPNPG
jgi:lipopolysaccharide export system protein LptC